MSDAPDLLVALQRSIDAAKADRQIIACAECRTEVYRSHDCARVQSDIASIRLLSPSAFRTSLTPATTNAQEG